MKSLNRIRCFLSDLIDRLVNFFKWPFAFGTVFYLPSALYECWPSVLHLIRSTSLVPFLLGIIVFWFVNKLMRKTWFWQCLAVLEHETVHLVVGLATLKIPNRWRVSSQGGHVGFDRGNNWIITISPYIFPLIPFMTFVTIQTFAAFSPLRSWVLPAAMGFSMAMHLAFTRTESHFQQPDIQRVGWLFALLVGPTLHLIFLAVVLILSSSNTFSGAGGPIANLFQRVGQNGFVAWKSVAIHGSEFIFENDGSEDRFADPSLKYPKDPHTKSAASATSGIRFERDKTARGGK